MPEDGRPDRVLEIGGHAAGFCGRLFVQAGHEVVRVDSGEDPPAWVSPASLALHLHAGKRRVETGSLELIAELAGRADVVVAEAATADALSRLGFDAWSAPVKVAVTPFGRTGPKRNWQATPGTLLAMGGYTNVMGDADRAPLTLPGSFVESQAGALAYTAANAARLAERSTSVDVAMLEVVMALSQFTTVLWHCAGEIRSRQGNDYGSIAPASLFRCADGWVYFNVMPAFWDRFALFLERPELVVDPRFRSNHQRVGNRDALHAIIDAALASLTRCEIQARADALRIPCGAVQSLDEVLSDPHLAARGFWQLAPRADGSAIRAPGPHWRIDPAPVPRPDAVGAEARDG